jgi:hypothetical protein
MNVMLGKMTKIDSFLLEALISPKQWHQIANIEIYKIEIAKIENC